MKKLSLILFVLLIAFVVSDCKKKRYPSDIPKWLKEKIDKMEKEGHRNGILKEKTCEYVVPRTVLEYYDGSSTFYWIGSSYNGFTIYNYYGQEVGGALIPYDKPIRTIWEEKCI